MGNAGRVKWKLRVGPIALQLHWMSRLRPSRLDALSVYKQKCNVDLKLPEIQMIIRDPRKEMSAAPRDSVELADNWRVWEIASGFVAQIWCSHVQAYAVEMHINHTFDCVEIFSLASHPWKKNFAFLVESTFKWVVSNYLIQNGGFLLHGASVLQKKSGKVFVGTGPSGAGKSTLSQFFQGDANYEVLTDETTIIVPHNGKFYAFGSPWPGMLFVASAAGGPLKKIFLLEKTAAPAEQKMEKKDRIVRLAREVFLPPWREEISERAIDNLFALEKSVQIGILGFKKDPSVVNYVSGVLR